MVDRLLWSGEGRQAEFEKLFEPTGFWQVLLGRSKGYLKTEIRCESQTRRRYRVFDYWDSHFDFEDFRRMHAADIEQFGQWVRAEGLVEKELLLGSFYEERPGADDGDDLVPA